MKLKKKKTFSIAKCVVRDMKSSHLTEKVMVLTPASVQAATTSRTRMHFITADSSKLAVRPTHKAALLFGANGQ